MEINKNHFDVAQVFQAYLQFNGDVVKTSVACEIAPEDVTALAVSERWESKLADLRSIQEATPDAQVQINRAINYVQAHRARSVLDKVLTELGKKDGAALVDFLTVKTEKVSEFKSRALTDLVKAMEACQQMTARALGDSGADNREEKGKAGSSVALTVMRAMSAADNLGVDSVEVVKRQLNP